MKALIILEMYESLTYEQKAVIQKNYTDYIIFRINKDIAKDEPKEMDLVARELRSRLHNKDIVFVTKAFPYLIKYLTVAMLQIYPDNCLCNNVRVLDYINGKLELQ